MELKRIPLTDEQLRQYFPQLIRDSDKTYRYFIEISAVKASGKKTYASIHMSAYRDRIETIDNREFIMRELFVTDIPCVRAYFPKLMRAAARDQIYLQGAQLLREKMHGLSADGKISESHPYFRAAMEM